MRTIFAILCCLCLSGCSSPSSGGTALLKPDATDNARYLDKASLEAVMSAVQNLRYPLTRAETLAQLNLNDRQLPGLISMEPVAKRMLPEDRELIHLTDSEKPGQHYDLLLWYDPSARMLSGDDFIKAKIINYAEILIRDDGRSDTPKGVYVMQAPRYPYVRLEHPQPATVQK